MINTIQTLKNFHKLLPEASLDDLLELADAIVEENNIGYFPNEIGIKTAPNWYNERNTITCNY